MSKDRIQYLENAIRNTDKQLEMLKLNRRIFPNLLETLNKQRLHFQQELARINISESKPKQRNPGLFGLMDILDDEDIVKLPANPSNSNKKSV
jgi:uncharacterized protein YjgD (DUF1641 family)